MNFKPYFKDHLGPEFWVETESRDPVMNHNLKIFERKNNFAVPSDLADFFLDTNGASVKWGDDKGSAKPMGHLSVIKLDKISRIDDGMSALSNCDCCPSTAFTQHGQIFLCDKTWKVDHYKCSESIVNYWLFHISTLTVFLTTLFTMQILHYYANLALKTNTKNVNLYICKYINVRKSPKVSQNKL